MATKAEKSQSPTQETEGRKTIPLRAPIKFEDIETSELVLDLDGLTGQDMEAAEAAVAAEGVVMVVPESSKRYQMHLAAKAAGVPVELLRKLGAGDATKVTMAVQNFLMG